MNDENAINITTSYITTIYENAENGFCISLYKNEATGEQITCKGNFLPNIKNIKYEMSGSWINVPKYGMNFVVDSYKELLENTRESIVSYLSSGVISGIGKATAERIYLRFGADSLKVIEDTPEKLLGIKGISVKKLEQIKQSYAEKHLYRDIIEFLLPFGITAKQTVKVINELKIKNIAEIKANPYQLYNIHGINIQCVDAIAKKVQFPEDSPIRLQAHAKHVLIENEQCGHTGMEANDFGRKLIRSLRCNAFNTSNICAYTIELLKDGTLKHCKREINGEIITFIYRACSFNAELEIAKNLSSLTNEKQPVHSKVKEIIERNCKKEGIILDDDQMNAVISIIENSFLIITGGPGTGKTTIMKQAAQYLKEYEKDREIFFMAPSGRASRRIKEATGFNGRTIHASFNLMPGELNIHKDDEITMENATIFCDESSMVGIFLMMVMTQRIKPGCRFIFVGDENQLPSVECGAVLRDLIASEKVPVIRLTKIHRQSEDSMIYYNSKLIENGNAQLKEGKDFKIIQSDSSIEAERKIVAHYEYYAQKYGLENIYCIVPRKEGYAGVKNLNLELQADLNPLKDGMEVFKANGFEFRVNDPVMHLKNGQEVANGDIGFVTRIFVDEEKGKTIEVTYFGDTRVSYTMDNIKEMVLAYAFTVHKSQGSENKIVLTYLSKECGKQMLKRNLPYTAITRGKCLVELFLTNDSALKDAVANDDRSFRITSLQHHMTAIFGGWMPVQ